MSHDVTTLAGNQKLSYKLHLWAKNRLHHHSKASVWHYTSSPHTYLTLGGYATLYRCLSVIVLQCQLCFQSCSAQPNQRQERIISATGIQWTCIIARCQIMTLISHCPSHQTSQHQSSSHLPPTWRFVRETCKRPRQEGKHIGSASTTGKYEESARSSRFQWSNRWENIHLSPKACPSDYDSSVAMSTTTIRSSFSKKSRN